MKILVVDDELGLRHTLSLILGEDGHAVVVAVRAHHDDDRAPARLSIAVEERKAVEPGHAHVAQHEIRIRLARRVEPRRAVRRDDDGMAILAEDE